MPSSVSFGSRPRMRTAPAYSSSVSPCKSLLISPPPRLAGEDRGGGRLRDTEAPPCARRALPHPSLPRKRGKGLPYGAFAKFHRSQVGPPAGTELAMTMVLRARSSRRQRLGEAGEKGGAVGAAEDRVGRILGVRHEAEHRLRLVEDAGDAARRAVVVVLFRQGTRGTAIAE